MKRGRDKFRRFKPVINLLIKFHMILPRGIRVRLFEHHRMTKGIKGVVIRYILLKTLAKNVGDNVSIHPNVYIFNMDKLSIGNDVSIHPMCYIEAKGGIKIGNDVSIAHSVTLLSVNHIFSELNIPIKDQGIEYIETEIKSDVWVGAKASILAGVTVEEGTIIATGAVVTKNVEKYSVVGGVPAKLIKTRS
ncbi:acyltransferase [Peribacillus frigoritolerans]|uniref:acyltransferase n=1 Tax=Peribacillus frigoritolerans TaxID=450367 RepID=UPI0021AA2FBF|nr:acyltransferase [Peribacillus frigoritolerans]MCT4478538.1 acyltransferase [Peribacillus frigoritolerans]